MDCTSYIITNISQTTRNFIYTDCTSVEYILPLDPGKELHICNVPDGSIESDNYFNVDILNDGGLCGTPCFDLIHCSNPALNLLNVSATGLHNHTGKLIKISTYGNNAFYVVEKCSCDYYYLITLGTVTYLDKCPAVPKFKALEPGYTTGNLKTDYVENIKCTYADLMYKKALENAYGVHPCCQEERERYIIKNEILNIDLNNDPDFCQTEC